MRETLKMLAVLAALFAAIALGLLALGVGLGFVLHATFSKVDLGAGILIGVVTAGLSIHFLVRVLHVAQALEGQDAAEGEAGDRVVYYLPTAIPTRRNRKKKRE